MYSDEKLLFYDLFIKSLIENYLTWAYVFYVTILWQSDKGFQVLGG